MKCFNRFCICFVLFSMCLSHCLTSFATELVDSSDNYEFDPVSDELPEDLFTYSDVMTMLDELMLEDVDDGDLYEVEPVADFPSFSVLRSRSRSSLPLIGDEPPSDPLFYGSCWVTGYDSNLGEVTIYFPLSSKEDVWGVDGNGYLFNITSSSVSGYLDGVYNNSVSCSGFSYPRYRESSGSGYNYVDLHLIPSDSNMEIATALEPAQNVNQLMPYVYVVLLGVIIVCFMKRF